MNFKNYFCNINVAHASSKKVLESKLNKNNYDASEFYKTIPTALGFLKIVTC